MVMSEDNFFDVEEKDVKEKKISETAEKNQKNRIDLDLDIGLDIPQDKRLVLSVVIEIFLILYLAIGLLGWVPLF